MLFPALLAHTLGVFVLEPRIARQGNFVGSDARGTEHDDGVADAFFLELRERMNVLGEDANGARGRAGHEGVIFVGSFWRVLGLEALSVGHERSPIQTSYDCRQYAVLAATPLGWRASK
jgi:hypothetical protein